MKPQKVVDICLFTMNGHTFSFKGCAVTVDNESVLVFTYKAMSDGKTKTHVANKANLAGWTFA